MTVNEIMNRPYTLQLVRNDDATWFAKVVEFPGCMTEGDTRIKALNNLDEVMKGWITLKLEDGEAIPESDVVTYP